MTPRGRRREGGVAVVEMAIALPLLVILALGVVEAAWAFGQQNAVRSMAREGARLAAGFEGSSAQIAQEICNLDELDSVIRVEASGVDPSSYERGDRGFVVIESTYDAITGFFPGFQSITLSSTAYFDAELVDRPDWWSTGGSSCP